MVNDAGTKVAIVTSATTTVAPPLPLQEHLLPLSNLDLLLPPLDVSVFFCYPGPAPTAAVLEEALAKTLVAYYPLAGEVVANGDGEPELMCNGRGVDFTEASVEGAMLRELRLGFMDEGVEKIVPAKKAGVMSVQVTKFKCGGAVVGCTFDHRVCDAYSFNMFLLAWTAATRGSSAPPAPSFCRSVVTPRDPPPRAPPTTALIDLLFAPRCSTPPPPRASNEAGSISRIYRISAADIAALQASAGPRRTRLEALTAYLWKLCSRAASSPRQPCCMGVVVDGRRRLFPDGAMNAYFGNVLTVPYGVIGSDNLRRMALPDVADDVHRWVAEAATGEHFRGLVEWVEEMRPKQAVARAYLGGTGGSEAMACIVSSGMSFPVGKADFGTGPPAFASYHFPWPGDCGYVMPMPSALGDGDWVVYAHVTPEMAKVIEEEPTLFQALDASYVFG